MTTSTTEARLGRPKIEGLVALNLRLLEADLDALDRIVALTGALVDRNPPRTVVLDPSEAADAIVEQLRSWGYLPDT